MIFPAFVICAWNSKYPIDMGIFHCLFENQDCQLVGSFEKMIVVGKGNSNELYCIRFNGGRKSKKKKLVPVSKTGSDYGVSVSFLIPDEVSESKMNN